MTLQVLHPQSNAVVESFPCTPDGNCFALVHDMTQFALRVKGPYSALFHPKHILVGGAQGLPSCEDLTFALKGYGCVVPVKVRTEEGDLVKGPAGIPIRLRENNPEGYAHVPLTDSEGLAHFDEVPSSILTAYFNGGEKTAPDGGKPTYKPQSQLFQIKFSKKEGFKLDQPDGFIIESTLVEGHIMQSLSDATPAPNIRVSVFTADEESREVQSVMTDGQGRFQLDSVKPGSYLLKPVSTDTSGNQFFKPKEARVHAVAAKKTEVSKFQVFGGSISGVTKLMKGALAKNVTIAVDGVNTTSSDSKGMYYLNFKEVPSKHTIQAYLPDFVFEPVEVTIREETRSLPEISAIATFICGKIFVMDWENDKQVVSLEPRTVRCLQEPNPLEEETWETAGILDRLVPERTTTINAEGEYCFTASPGLWRVTADVLKEEQDVGLQWHYSSDRGEMAFVTNGPITNLHIMQANKTAGGHVNCLDP